MQIREVETPAIDVSPPAVLVIISPAPPVIAHVPTLVPPMAVSVPPPAAPVAAPLLVCLRHNLCRSQVRSTFCVAIVQFRD